MQRILLVITVAILLCAGAGSTPVFGQDGVDEPAVDWLEPKGLNVVDLVGLAPDEHLQNAMVVFSGEGTAQYLSGSRNGDLVTVNARIYTKELGGVSYANCLGQWAHLDQWASAVPPGSARFYVDGQEVTDQVTYVQYYPAGQIQPDHGADRNRYDRTPQERASFNEDGSLRLAANTGCIISLPGYFPELTATFTFEYASPIRVEHVGQERFTFQTYIGVGEAGLLAALRDQMADRFGDRHDKFRLNPPATADYIFVNYPPTPVSAYGNGPVTNPSSGTYRLAEGESILSTDHLMSMGLPLYGHWRDADQSGGVRFLPEIENINTLTAPEYFVPAGFTYDPCMTNGGCSDELLDAIYDAEMTLTVYYYRVSRIQEGLDRIPLRLVGMRYNNLALFGIGDDPIWDAPVRQFLPLVRRPVQVEPDDTDGCPCGWFDEHGRMFDYIPRP
jgi:hypothetical protein